jgi:hypothetical protein
MQQTVTDAAPVEPVMDPVESTPMTEEDLRSLIAKEISAGIGEWSSELSERRTTAMKLYNGLAYGDEVEGYSAVVSRDIYESVQQILPDLLETFVGGDEVARVLPTTERDEEEAQVTTARLNHLFLHENPGFEIAHHWIVDALIQKNGIVKFWVEEYEEVTPFEKQDIPSEAVGVMLSMGVRMTKFDETSPGMFHCVGEITKRKQRIIIENVPPEEFGINRAARSMKSARCAFHITTTTAGALRELGYPADMIDMCPSPSGFEDTEEEEARAYNEGGEVEGFSEPFREGADKEKEVAEVYIWVDFDGDGKSELRRVMVGGRRATVVFSNDVVSFIPFASISPTLVPHRFFGTSIADALEDIQRINTVVKRQFLDGLYASTRPRYAVTGNAKTGPDCDVGELDTLRAGGHVTVYQAGALQPLQVTDATTPALMGLEYLRGLREERIGVSRVNTGSAFAAGDDATKLHGTAKGLQMLQASANKRVALIARIMAETGFKDLFQGLYRLLREVDGETEFQGRSGWAKSTPEMFETPRQVRISVGLGYGDRKERLEGLMMMTGLQERLTQAVPGQIVRPEHAYNLVDEICDVLGYRNANRFFGDPKDAPPQEPAPAEPWKVEVASKERMHIEDLRLEELKIRLDHEYKLRELGLREAEAEREAAETPVPLTGQLVAHPQSQMAGGPMPGQRTQPGGGVGNGAPPAGGEMPGMMGGPQ